MPTAQRRAAALVAAVLVAAVAGCSQPIIVHTASFSTSYATLETFPRERATGPHRPGCTPSAP